MQFLWLMAWQITAGKVMWIGSVDPCERVGKYHDSGMTGNAGCWSRGGCEPGGPTGHQGAWARRLRRALAGTSVWCTLPHSPIETVTSGSTPRSLNVGKWQQILSRLGAMLGNGRKTGGVTAPLLLLLVFQPLWIRVRRFCEGAVWSKAGQHLQDWTECWTEGSQRM